jgi:transposase
MSTTRELSAAEAAQILGVSQRTLTRWATDPERRDLKVVRRTPGGHGAIMVSAAQVERIRKARAEASTRAKVSA